MFEFARKQNTTQKDRSNHSGTKRVTPEPIATIPTLQRKSSCVCGGGCPKCLQAKHARTNETRGNTAPSAVNEVLRSSGQPLDGSTREFMESRFEHDFNRVRVHTDSKAIEAAQSVNALAFTVGHNIAFAKGQYAPETLSGKRLLAHELTHVTQQHGNRDILQKYSVEGGDPNDVHEREAEQIAGDVADGGPIPKRCPKPEPSECINGKWKFEYDGCSKPGFVPNAVKFNYNNPTRGKDTHFSKCAHSSLACDQHDECYQTFGSDKSTCDRVFLYQMLATCHDSKEGRAVKDRCYLWAYRYFQAVHLFGGDAYKSQQKRVGKCLMADEHGRLTSTTLPDPTRPLS